MANLVNRETGRGVVNVKTGRAKIATNGKTTHRDKMVKWAKWLSRYGAENVRTGRAANFFGR